MLASSDALMYGRHHWMCLLCVIPVHWSYMIHWSESSYGVYTQRPFFNQAWPARLGTRLGLMLYCHTPLSHAPFSRVCFEIWRWHMKYEVWKSWDALLKWCLGLLRLMFVGFTKMRSRTVAHSQMHFLPTGTEKSLGFPSLIKIGSVSILTSFPLPIGHHTV